MEQKKRRHRQLQTAALAAGIFFVLFVSFHRYLSWNLLTTSTSSATTTVYNIHNQYHNYAIIEQDHPHTDVSSLQLRLQPEVPPIATDGVLFPDWEVLLLLPPNDRRTTTPSHGLLSCLFQNGATSPANFSGVIPSSRRATYRCALPPSVRRLRTIYVPRLVPASPEGGARGTPSTPGSSRALLRWNFLVYESLTTNDDVIVFAKGINHRQGVDRQSQGLRCVFHAPTAGSAFRTAVTNSSQEVFRCPHPDEERLASLLAASTRAGEGIRISLEIGGRGPESGGNKAVPSLAEYRPRAPPVQDNAQKPGRSLLCACTMVFNVAKFLREWVVYHSRLGVDRFILYDNGSEDGLELAVAGLRRQGYNISSLLWLWPKTQEAGFSHCAAASRGHCDWMMFLDVDEFAFSPSWSNASRPSPDMLRSLLPPSSRPGDTNRSRARRPVGQVSMGCYEFGPSNRTVHPAGGVTQGYTCRRRAEERHKSIVRLEAVDPSLQNVVHHFRLSEGYRVKTVGAGRGTGVVVNHYKYQAWAEFKAKFRRRASAYVADWTQAVNAGSKDRTPGLGFSAVEPPGWTARFCEVKDSRLRDTVRKWFGRELDESSGDYRMEWEESQETPR